MSVSKTAENPDFFFRRRTPEQQRADTQFAKACDVLAAALETERQNAIPENRRARRAAEKAWEEARQARDKARRMAHQSSSRVLME